jgi:hypothetical protein
VSDLFTTRGDFAIDTTFATAKRRVLDEHSWVDVVPDWVSGPEQVFDVLATGVPWKQHYRRLFDRKFLEPRLTAEYRTIRDVPHPPLVDMAAVCGHHAPAHQRQLPERRSGRPFCQ